MSGLHRWCELSLKYSCVRVNAEMSASHRSGGIVVRRKMRWQDARAPSTLKSWFIAASVALRRRLSPSLNTFISACPQ